MKKTSLSSSKEGSDLTVTTKVDKDKVVAERYFYDFQKLAKDAEVVKYTDLSSEELEFCGNCQFYQGYVGDSVGTCSLVAGEVAQQGRCDLYSPIEKRSITEAKSFKYTDLVAFEATPTDDTGTEWNVRIINAGTSKNNRKYPKEVLHRDGKVFENVPVHAAVGEDHSSEERGVKSMVGYIKNITNVEEGLNATFHVSDPTIKAVLLDFHKEGVLNEMMGFSIFAGGKGEPDKDGTLVFTELTEGISVDLVREPAAGGKFLSVKEALMLKEMTQEQIEELLKETASKAAGEAISQFKSAQEKEQLEAKEKLEAEEAEAKEKKEKEEAEEAEKKRLQSKKDGKDGDDDSDKDASKKTSEAMNDAILTLHSATLTTLLSEAKLPETAQVRITEAFGNSLTLDPVKVQKAIQDEKDYLATHEKVIIENLTSERRMIGQVTTDDRDKMIARIDGMFDEDGFKELNGERIKAFSGWKEAYSRWYGLNPYDVETFEVVEEFFGPNNKMGRYDSDYKKATERIYTEALFQQSSLGQVTADRMHKALIENYLSFPQYQDWRKVVKVLPVDDYQAYRRIKIGGYANLVVVVEGGTYPEITHFADEETTITLQKRGGIVPQITRELIINDSVGSIAKIPRELARAAARTLYETVFNTFRDNSVYGVDSLALFHANHNNTGTTALSVSGLNLANVAMRSQTRALNTADILGEQNKPKYLVGPNELEGLTDRLVTPSTQIVSQLTADTDAMMDAIRFKGKMERLTVDYWTNATDYFLVADPNQNEGIIVIFLNGQEEPGIFIQQGETVGEQFTMDVHNIKIRHEFATGISDFRPFYRQDVA